MTTHAMPSQVLQPRPNIIVVILRWILRLIVPVFLVAVTGYFGVVLGTAIYLQYFHLPAEVPVPKIIGRDVQEAQRLLQRLGLELDISEAKFQEKVKKDQVMEQDPHAGRTVREGRKVAVVVSLGPEQVTVPRLTGLGMRDAEIALSNARLNLGKVTLSDRRKGDPEMVIDQNPRPGKSVKKGVKVNITINMGNVEMVKVPRFEGMMIDKVRESAGQAGLKLGSVQWILHEQYNAGTIIRQDPPPNKAVPPGTPVELKVSAGNDYRVHEIRQKQVTVVAPDAAGPQEIRIMVIDPTGSYAVYQGTHYAGEQVSVLVTGVNGGEYETYSNEKLLHRDRI